MRPSLVCVVTYYAPFGLIMKVCFCLWGFSLAWVCQPQAGLLASLTTQSLDGDRPGLGSRTRNFEATNRLLPAPLASQSHEAGNLLKTVHRRLFYLPLFWAAMGFPFVSFLGFRVLPPVVNEGRRGVPLDHDVPRLASQVPNCRLWECSFV